VRTLRGIGLLVVLAAASACGDVASPSVDCGVGTHVALDGDQYCVYDESVVIEGGFSCPTELPVEIPVEGGVVCAADGTTAADVPAEVCVEALGRECGEPTPMRDAGLPAGAGVDAATEPDAGPPTEDRIVYVSNESGTLELWAVRMDGSDPVRLSEGLSDTPDQHAVRDPRVSPDGTTVGVMSVRQPDGTFGVWPGDVQLWLVDLTTGEHRHVVHMGYQSGFDFDPSGDSVVYGDAVTCSVDLHRRDLSTGEDTLVYDIFEVAENPNVNPVNPNLVAYSFLECAVGSRAEVADLVGLSPIAVPGSGPVPGQPPRGHAGGWDSTGTRLAFFTKEAVRIWEMGSETSETVLEVPEGYGVERPIFGPGDDHLLLRYYGAGEPSEVHRLDLDSGELTPLGIVAGTRFDWGPMPADIDRDGDGLANGIDPSPDG